MNYILLTAHNQLESVVQLITVTLIFIFVLFITYWTTRFAGNYKKQQMVGKNIQIVETVSISNSKFLQIVKVGNKFFLISLCKDMVSLLSELNEEDIDLQTPVNSGDAFKSILEKFKKNEQVNSNEKKDS